MKNTWQIVIACLILGIVFSCHQKSSRNEFKERNKKEVTAEDILGNPEYQAISYGGYRAKKRETQPSLDQLKDDMRILSAVGIKILRTYNVQLPHATNVLKAIRALKEEEPGFEMYVMLGAWIDCKNAWSDQAPDHNAESEQNQNEIARAVDITNQYPDIVKVIAVGNEAMVKWAESYYVQPEVILKWVTHLQNLKTEGQLPEEIWITSSDDFSSWGGGDSLYHTEELEKLIKAVDYISMHTYAYHNSHYNPQFWKVPEEEFNLSDLEKVEAAMLRAKAFAQSQYDSVKRYMKSLGVDKPIHIGETGWATVSDGYYGPEGSKAADEYKQGLYYKYMREWTNEAGISCFYFEAFDEQWKDAGNPQGSENHFGLFTIDGQAKYPVWDLVDQGIFEGLTRDNRAVAKTYGGHRDSLMVGVLTPPLSTESTPQN
ncbi:MAG: glycosyl hydrolase family 17 protein [Bacteroidota bacterium]